MQFNRRVLEEAEDATNPLLERVKFLAITGSNLDEYVEIRQAGLMQRIEDGYREPGYDGLRPAESLAVLTAEIHKFVAAQYQCWNKQLLPELRKQGIRLLDVERAERGGARNLPSGYFQREVDPLLTPISIDPGASLSARAEQGALPGTAAEAQAPQLRAAGAGRGDGAARVAPVCAPALRPTATTTTCCCRT